MKAIVTNKDNIFYGRLVDGNLKVNNEFEITGVLTNDYDFNRNSILNGETISANDVEEVMGEGLSMIGKERIRQIEQKGYSYEHDMEHLPKNFVYAAQAYLTRNAELWPWESKYFKPSKNMVRNLEKAGALIAAAIDRILLDEENKKE
jgi:hypothetical protein